MVELLRYFTKSLLKMRHRDIQKIYPQLAIFNFDLIGRKVTCDGFYDKKNLEFLQDIVFPKLKSRDVFLDIGANIGNHSVFCADNFNEIYAFEPNLRTFKILEANAMLKNNIQVFNIGLSNKKHSQTASFDTGNLGSASLVHAGSDSLTVQFNLDCFDQLDLLSKDRKIDFIKIDVEGFELQALQGCERTLLAHKPVIAMEVLKSDMQNGGSAALEYLVLQGYNFQYCIQEASSFWGEHKSISRLFDAISVLFRGKKRVATSELVRINGKLSDRDHPMILLSVAPL